MTRELIERSREQRAQRVFADVALVVIAVVLVVSIAVAATAVSIGIARADTLAGIAENDGRVALAVFVGLVIAVMGGFTAAMTRDGEYPSRRG